MSIQAFSLEEEVTDISVGGDWDVVIIGAGPAGLTAGIYSTRMGLKTLIIEKASPGGKVLLNPWIENYLGFPGIKGDELASRFAEHAKASGVIILSPVEAKEVRINENSFQVVADSETFNTKAVIFATGGKERKLNVPGEEEFYGRGVSYCTICDGPLFRDKVVAVIGGGNSAVTSAIYLTEFAKEVYLIHRRNDLRAERALIDKLFQANVRIIWNTVIKAINGRRNVEGIRIYNKIDGKESILKVDGVFINIGYEPNSEIAVKMGVKVDERGYIITNRWMETNVPGIFAAGDVTGKPEQIAKAVGEGTVAALSAYEYITGGVL